MRTRSKLRELKRNCKGTEGELDEGIRTELGAKNETGPQMEENWKGIGGEESERNWRGSGEELKQN